MMHDPLNRPVNPLWPMSRCEKMALMIIHDWSTVAPMESELARQGYQVLRAQHAMHGYWLAMNLQPSVIVTDLHEVESPSDHLLGYLKGSDKTRAIPVVYLSDHASAELADRLRSRGIARCLPKRIDPDRFVCELSRLLFVSTVDATNAQQANATHDATKIDAVFSELGDETKTDSATPSPGWLPHRVDQESPQDPSRRDTRRRLNHGQSGPWRRPGKLQRD